LNIPYPIRPFEGENEIGIFYQVLNQLVRGDGAPPFSREERWKLFENEPDWHYFTARFNQTAQSFNAAQKQGDQFVSFKFPTHMASLFNSHKGSTAKHELVKNLDAEFHHTRRIISAPTAQIAPALPPEDFPCM
jgi:hypothetical protein